MDEIEQRPIPASEFLEPETVPGWDALPYLTQNEPIYKVRNSQLGYQPREVLPIDC
jgi:hypothetical protein